MCQGFITMLLMMLSMELKTIGWRTDWICSPTCQLWTTKLEETHVFDPEPTAQPAAQYLSLIQRSQVQLRPTTPVSLINTSVAVPVRQLNVASRMVVSSVNSGAGSAESVSLSVAAPGSLSNIRPHTTRTTDAVIPNNLTQSGAHLTQAQRFSQHPVVHGGLIGGVPAVIPSSAATTQLFPQHSRTVGSATIQSGATPQLAALPSGLTGKQIKSLPCKWF
ncbi:unnamed protein product [Dicrocoelium dendriticum]|nr:unnamed protein product [Dicrocoelium dendriticum]